MNRQLTVALGGACPNRAAAVRGFLASLPSHFTETQGSIADVTVVCGDLEGWDELARQAIGRDSAVLLCGIALIESDSLTELARAAAGAGVALSLDSGYACAPGWLSVLPELCAQARELTVLDSMAVAGCQPSSSARHVALRNALVGQLLLVEPILDDLDSLRVLHSSDGSYVLGGQMTGVATTLAGATTAGAGHLQLDAACAEVRWQARFASEFLAQPARVSALDAGGERVQHGSYESGHRVCWLNLHAALTEGLPLLIPVEQVVRSLAVADVALGR